MEVENKDVSENTLANGSSHVPKRGRGRPRGSPNKKFTSEKTPTHNARASRKVDFFSPEASVKSKVKKRGRPKKLKMRGRPRKIPLTPEEETERLHRLSVTHKRKLSKPLGRPRIHPIVEGPKTKRGRGRPRKHEATAESPSQNDTDSEEKEYPASIAISLDVADDNRQQPLGSNIKRDQSSASTSVPSNMVSDGTPSKMGRPPGSKEVDGPRKRGRPPGSPNKVKNPRREDEGTPRKRGRPPGSGNKVKFAEKNIDGPQRNNRPSGTGKIKICVPDDVDLDLDDFEGTSFQGCEGSRSGKVRLVVVLEKLSSTYIEEITSHKPLCDSVSLPQSQNETNENPRARENSSEVGAPDIAADCPKVKCE